MKYFLSALVLCIIFTFSACKSDSEFQKPVNFYYRTSEISYNSESGVVCSEIRESKPYDSDLTSLFNHYLQGPTSDSLSNPFPQTAKVNSVRSEDNTLIIEVNDAYAQLSGIDLTLANSCLCKTALEITQMDAVKIFCVEALMDGYQSVTLTNSDLLLIDSAETVPTTTSP